MRLKIQGQCDLHNKNLSNRVRELHFDLLLNNFCGICLIHINVPCMPTLILIFISISFSMITSKSINDIKGIYFTFLQMHIQISSLHLNVIIEYSIIPSSLKGCFFHMLMHMLQPVCLVSLRVPFPLLG